MREAFFVVGAPPRFSPKRGGNGGWVADKEMMEGMVAGLLIKKMKEGMVAGL